MTVLDLQLIRKYNQPTPRYTSYPPATRFNEQYSTDTLLSRIENSSKCDSKELSLYFHLPFCRSLCWYCGCNTIITTQQGQSASYLELLAREIELLKPFLNPHRKVVQVHFGGGTPTFLLPDELRW